MNNFFFYFFFFFLLLLLSFFKKKINNILFVITNYFIIVVTPTEVNTVEVTTPSTTSIPNTTSPTSSPSPIESDDLLIQSTNLPVFLTEFKNEEAYCIISSKTFKEIIEEEGKVVRKWKWIVIGCTSIIGGVIGFRIWRYYRRKRRAEALAALSEEAAQHPEEYERLRRLEEATVDIDPHRRYSFCNFFFFF